MNFARRLIANITSLSGNYQKIRKETEELKLLIAKTLIANQKNFKTIKEAEFKVFSQWGDDGIIQFLIHNLDITNDYFVEFGVENYVEANTRFLLMNNNWRGLVMDGSADHVDYIKRDDIYWKYQLQAKHAFITAENINDLLRAENVPPHIGLLHIDIDGNDYWVWKNIECVKADIVIVEYNSIFGADRSITIPYKSSFNRAQAHHSNLYYGSSLGALCDLAKEKGYSFIGCNSAGNNAYFVLNEKLSRIEPVSVSEGFVTSRFKESRNESGALNYLSGKQREEKIKGMEVFNVRTNKTEPF